MPEIRIIPLIVHRLGCLSFRRCFWATTVFALSVLFTVRITLTFALYFFIPLDFLIAILCVGAMWPTRSDQAANVLLAVAQAMAVGLYGASQRLSHDDEHAFPCLTSALQMLSCLMGVPLRVQTLPMLSAIIVPMITYPDDFLQPVPIVLVVCALIMTILVSPRGSTNAQSASRAESVSTRSAPRRVNGRSSPSSIRPPVPPMPQPDHILSIDDLDPSLHSRRNSLSSRPSVAFSEKVPSSNFLLPLFFSNESTTAKTWATQSSASSVIERKDPTLEPPSPVSSTLSNLANRKRSLRMRETASLNSLSLATKMTDLEKQRASATINALDPFSPILLTDDVGPSTSSPLETDSVKPETPSGSSFDGPSVEQVSQEPVDMNCSADWKRIRGIACKLTQLPSDEDLELQCRRLQEAIRLRGCKVIPEGIHCAASSSSSSSSTPAIPIIFKNVSEPQPKSPGASDRSDFDVHDSIESFHVNDEENCSTPSSSSCSKPLDGKSKKKGEVVFAKQYAVLKGLLDEEESEKKKAQDDLALQNERTRELAFNCELLKERLAEEVQKKQKAESSVRHLTEQLSELQLRHDIVKSRYDEGVSTQKKATEQLEKQISEMLELRLQYAIVKGQYDNGMERMKQSESDYSVQRNEALELKNKYAVLKAQFDEEISRHKRYEDDLVQQRQIAMEIRQKYELLKGSFDEAVNEKLKTDTDLSELSKQALEYKKKCTLLNERTAEALNEKKKADCALVQQRQLAREIQLKYGMLKVHFDESLEMSKKTEDSLEEQLERSRDMKLKYEVLKESFDLQFKDNKKSEEDLDVQCQQVKELKQKCDSLNDITAEALENKKKADDDLVDQYHQMRALQLKYGILKVHYDKGVELQKKCQTDLEEQLGRTAEMKAKYDSLKQDYDEQFCKKKGLASVGVEPQLGEVRKATVAFGPVDKVEIDVNAEPAGLRSMRNLSRQSIDVFSNDGIPTPSNLMSDQEQVSTIGHGIRTHITTTLSVMEILLDTKVKLEDADRQDLMQKARSSLQRALLMVSNLLDFSKLSTATIRPIPKQVNIRRLAIQLLRGFEAQAKQENTELILDVAAPLPTSIQLDRFLLQRILVNLVSNSMKQAVQRIVLGAGWDPSCNFLQVSLAVKRNPTLPNSSSTASSSSSSSSLPPAPQAWPLCPSSSPTPSSISSSPTTLTNGRGGDFSLSISQQLVSEMGGSISIFRGDSDGSMCFRFEVPATLSKNVSCSIDVVVLCIDDDPVRHRSIVEMLRYVGVYVLESGGALAGISPGLVFIAATQPNVETLVHQWREELKCLVCLIVPNNFAGRFDTIPVDAILRSPIDIAELRAILHNFPESEGCAQSDSSFQISPIPSILSNGSGGGAQNGNGSEGSAASSNNSSLLDDVFLLLAEDNPINHSLFLRQLRSLGLTNIDSAYNGAEAVERAQNKKYTVIVMDSDMPILDGLDATRQIRTFPDHVTTPIISLTASLSNETLAKCRAYGVTEVLTKPMTLDNWRKILGLVQKRASSRGLEAAGSQT